MVGQRILFRSVFLRGVLLLFVSVTFSAIFRENRWRKRGICAVPTKFGISFTESFMNQSGALVHIYNDGNVLLSHGGTEMGQGLFTKMIQVRLMYVYFLCRNEQ